MTQDEIIIRKGIVHILDAELGYPVFSEELLDLSPDTNDFFRGLIYKIMSGDEMKKCFFDGFEESSELRKNPVLLRRRRCHGRVTGPIRISRQGKAQNRWIF